MALLLLITYRPRICLLSVPVPCDGDMEQTSKLPILEQTHILFTCACGYVLCLSGWLLSIIGGMSLRLAFVCPLSPLSPTFSFLSLLTWLRECRLLVATVTPGTTEVAAEGQSWSVPSLGQASRRSTARVRRLASPEGFSVRKRLGHLNRLPRNLKGGGRWAGVWHSRVLGQGQQWADLRASHARAGMGQILGG